MTFFRISVFVAGLFMLVYGLLIVLAKKNNLVRGFGEKLGNGVKDEVYAKKVGLIQVAFGGLLIVCGGLSYLLEMTAIGVILAACVFLFFFAYMILQFKTSM